MSNLKMPNLLEKEERKQTGLPMPVLTKGAGTVRLSFQTAPKTQTVQNPTVKNINMSQLEAQRLQAAKNEDWYAVDQINAQMKALRAAAGQQTLADRMQDTVSGTVYTEIGQTAGALGMLGQEGNKLERWGEQTTKQGEEQIAGAKEGLGGFGQALVDLGVGTTQIVGDIGLSAIAPGAGLAAMGVRAFGGGAQQARQEGAERGEQLGYAAANAAKSILVERIANVAGPFKKAFGNGILNKALDKVTAKPAGKLLISALSEGGEEMLEAALDPALQKLTYNPDAEYNEDVLAEMLYSGALGAVLGGFGGGVDVVTGRGKTAPEANKDPYDIMPKLEQKETDTAKAANPSPGADRNTVPISKFNLQKAEQTVKDPYDIMPKLDGIQNKKGSTLNQVLNMGKTPPQRTPTAPLEILGSSNKKLTQQRNTDKNPYDIMPKLVEVAGMTQTPMQQIHTTKDSYDIVPKLDDGLGAANVNSLNTDYDRLQAQSDSFHPEGANAVRHVDVPTHDFAGRRISKSASTVMGAEAIPDSVIPQIEQMVADGQLSYVRRGDRSAINNARRLVVDNGFDGALERFRSAVTSGKISKDTVVLGQTLMNNAANTGDGKALAEILTLYQSLNTNAGQAVQAASILRKLSPEAQLYGIQKTVNSMNDNLQKSLKNFPGAEIDTVLIDKFLAQTNQAGRDAVMEEIYQNVADQVPSTWQDKWNAWRYLAMLGNPRTHIRNIVGNVGFQPVRIIKNEIATALERVFSAVGVNIERTKSFAVAPSLYRAAWNDYGNAAGVLGGSKYDDVRGEIQSRRRIFKTDMLEAVRKGNSAALEFEDAVFKRITYADALAGYLQANGATAAQLESGQIDSALLSHARDYAVQEALKATYQDSNVIAERTSRIAKSMGVVGDAVMPFQRTPANILSRALEYSPAGLIKSLTVDLAKVKEGNMSVSQALDNVAAGLTGSGLFGLGMHLFALGLVTAGQGDDEDDKWNTLLGHQGYALELPDGTSVTLDWLAPESLPFFMGVEFMSAVGENGFQTSDIVDAMKSVANPMLELSMLQGVNDLIESVRYAEEAPLMAIVPSVITSYFSQAVPTLLGQLERSGENVRMTTYTDKNSNLHPDIQYAIGRASSRIPGVDYAQIPYIDAWGREEESDELLERTVKNLLNPAYVSQVEVDSVEKELQRLRDSTGDTAVFPDRAERYITVDGKRKDLTAEEYVSYAKKLGQESYNLISQAVNSSMYRTMSDSNKVEYLGRIYDYAKQTAKASVSNYVVDTWVRNAQNARRDIGVSPAEYMALYEKYGSEIMNGADYEKTKLAVSVGLTVDEYADAKYSLDADGNGSVTQAEAQAYLDHQDFSMEQKANFWPLINKGWKTNPYK